MVTRKLNLNRYKAPQRKRMTRVKATKVKGGSRLPIAYQDPFMSWAETRKQGK